VTERPILLRYVPSAPREEVKPRFRNTRTLKEHAVFLPLPFNLPPPAMCIPCVIKCNLLWLLGVTVLEVIPSWPTYVQQINFALCDSYSRCSIWFLPRSGPTDCGQTLSCWVTLIEQKIGRFVVGFKWRAPICGPCEPPSCLWKKSSHLYCGDKIAFSVNYPSHQYKRVSLDYNLFSTIIPFIVVPPFSYWVMYWEILCLTFQIFTEHQPFARNC
jgi:hypothetical protein